jgi:uncharacterized protein (DUF58 family)
MDFDDLREYVVGDDIKDIDWKASARSHVPLVKRYNANRKHPVTFIMNSGRGMEAITDQGSVKKEVSTQILGVLGFIALQHSDTVGVIYGDEERAFYLPHRETETHLNRSLKVIYENTTLDSPPGNIHTQLLLATKSIRSRGITIVISDEFAITHELDYLLKRLQVTQEVLWVTVRDADPLVLESSVNVVEDVETFQFIPDYIRENKKLKGWFSQREAERHQNVGQYMSMKGISHTEVSSPDEVVPTLISLLNRRSRGRK